uniref:phosphorylase kinase n=1 Tax=Daphnia magna TaxID=35525 RepID=A0A0P5JX96_9CRUS
MARDETDDVLPDKDLFGFILRVELLRYILGRGVSSTVRRCVEKETGREYACKIMDINGDPSETEGPAMRESTLREIAILRRVAGHPYIIELHDVFESETFIFLVFELCRNGELFDYLTSVVTLSEKKTKYIMKQLFEALQHVHRMNIVHRDLKPENILLDDNLNVKLTDFGFARILQPGEKLFELVGTPGYLAPELLKSNMFEGYDGYSKEVDMWACGVIMFTLLIGCPPFWHRKQMVMLRNIMEGRYSFTSPEWDDITDAPKDLISKLLILDPKRRLTVDEALKHEFFQVLRPDDFSIISSSTGLGAPGTTHYHGRVFNARRMFRFGILCVQSMVRIRRLKLTPEPLSIMVARRDPYRMKAVRKVIDACAFRVYAHWVKKGEGQNRAALFEHHPKIELKHLYLSNLNQNRS